MVRPHTASTCLFCGGWNSRSRLLHSTFVTPRFQRASAANDTRTWSGHRPQHSVCSFLDALPRPSRVVVQQTTYTPFWYVTTTNPPD